VKGVELLKLKSEVNKYDQTFVFFKMSMSRFLKIVIKVYDIMLAFILGPFNAS
jgi:hypothetical protein